MRGRTRASTENVSRASIPGRPCAFSALPCRGFCERALTGRALLVHGGISPAFSDVHRLYFLK